MPPTVEQAIDPSELLLQGTGDPGPLELFIRLAGSREHHLYVNGLGVAELGRFFATTITPLSIIITRMPFGLLNPNYWEPLTRDSEREVREKLVGVVTRSEGDHTQIWRADRISPSRLLRDGVEVPVTLLNGYAFAVDGKGFLDLLEAWDGKGRIEWAALEGVPTAGLSTETLAQVHLDLAQRRVSLTDEIFLCSTEEDGRTRLVFSDVKDFHRTVEAVIRGFVHRVAGSHLGHINRQVCNQIARVADGVGISAAANSTGVVDKGRSVEVHAALGRTPWGISLNPGEDPPHDGDRVLIYYDRISGIWAVST